jgi:hypothetical protein
LTVWYDPSLFEPPAPNAKKKKPGQAATGTLVQKVKEEILSRRHEPVSELGKWLRSVEQGHLNYYAVPGNKQPTDAFRSEVMRGWFFW